VPKKERIIGRTSEGKTNLEEEEERAEERGFLGQKGTGLERRFMVCVV
jgi:hypothetical protein